MKRIVDTLYGMRKLYRTKRLPSKAYNFTRNYILRTEALFDGRNMWYCILYYYKDEKAGILTIGDRDSMQDNSERIWIFGVSLKTIRCFDIKHHSIELSDIPLEDLKAFYNGLVYVYRKHK